MSAITPKELRALAADKALDIGTAWNALEAAADKIETLENDKLPSVASNALLGKELPDCEGKWIRSGGNLFACTVQWEKPIPGCGDFEKHLIIFFKLGNYWRVKNLPMALRGGWYLMPNASGEGRQPARKGL